MNVKFAAPKIRLFATLLCLVCALALLPATLLAYVGVIWLPDVGSPSNLSAAAMVVGPLPLTFAAFLSWEAAQERSGRKLLKGAAFTLAATALYVVAWVWGGRMFI